MLKGFKSIREMDLELRPLNVLIGANGAGKSNLISFFRMLNEMTGGRLQNRTSPRPVVPIRSFSMARGYDPDARLVWNSTWTVDCPGRTYEFRLLSHAAGDHCAISCSPRRR